MASFFGHSIMALAIAGFTKTNRLALLVILAVFSALLPDFDVIGFEFGIAYESFWGHRGFSHSFFFAFFWAGFLSLVFGRDKKLLWFFILFLATASNGILDGMTTGGKGVAFFSPFENGRYFLPEVFRKIKVSPIGISKFFSSWGLQVIKSELIFVGIPSAIILGIKYFFYKRPQT